MSVVVEKKSSVVDSVEHDDWYFMLFGAEMGPVNFVDLVNFAIQNKLNADDEVRLGLSGAWRRADSIDRLASVLSNVDLSTQLVQPVRNGPPTRREPPTRPESNPSRPAPQNRILETEPTLDQPRQAPRSVVALPPAKRPKPAAEPVSPVDQTPRTPSNRRVSVQSPSPVSPSSPLPGEQRSPWQPPQKPRRTTPRRTSSLTVPNWVTPLLLPRTLGTFASVVVVLALGIWFFTSERWTTDEQKYNDLKQILTDVRALREGKEIDAEALNRRALEVGGAITRAFESRTSLTLARNLLFKAAHDELPRLMHGALTKSPTEDSRFAAALAAVADALKI